LPPARFVAYLQNHDQVANSARGLRGHQLTSAAKWRAMTALLVLMPATPMLFQGQEFSASAPFLYFADLKDDLAASVRKGRAEFLKQFSSVAHYEQVAQLDDPSSVATFERSKLDLTERHTHRAAYDLHRDLLALRRSRPAFRAQRRIDGAVLSANALIVRFAGDASSDDRALILNLGRDLNRATFAEPLFAPPQGFDWHIEWSSEDPRYGGSGVADLWRTNRWTIPAESATVLAPGPMFMPAHE
jgi:maltooligosyltrehalose trehalohydrolase